MSLVDFNSFDVGFVSGFIACFWVIVGLAWWDLSKSRKRGK